MILEMKLKDNNYNDDYYSEILQDYNNISKKDLLINKHIIFSYLILILPSCGIMSLDSTISIFLK